MEGQSGATGLQLKVISFWPKLTRAKETASGGGNGPTLILIKSVCINKKVMMHSNYYSYLSMHIRISSIVLKIAICDPLSLAHSMIRPIKSVLKVTLS
jgi:hypothetical protein